MKPEEFKKLVPGQEVAVYNFFAERFFVSVILDTFCDADGNAGIILNESIQAKVTIKNCHNVFLTTKMNKEERRVQKIIRDGMKARVKESLKTFENTLTPYFVRMFKQGMTDWEDHVEIRLRKRKK